jgi:hypothetical protein
MPVKETIAVYCENRTKPKSALYQQNEEFFYINEWCYAQ